MQLEQITRKVLRYKITLLNKGPQSKSQSATVDESKTIVHYREVIKFRRRGKLRSQS